MTEKKRIYMQSVRDREPGGSELRDGESAKSLG